MTVQFTYGLMPPKLPTVGNRRRLVTDRREPSSASRRPSGDESQRVEDLREQVTYLREQLDRESEARTEERRRQDTIIAQLSAANAEQARTIRAIEAPASEEEAAEDAETVEEAPERAEPRSDVAGAQAATQPPQGGGLRGLRRRILGW